MIKINEETNAVEAANAKIQSIRQAIVNGDKKFTASDLSNAKNELEFAELQDEAKRVAEQKAIDNSRRADLLNLQKTLAQIADSRPVIDKKFIAFEKNLSDYLSAVVVHYKELRAVREALMSGGFLPNTTPGAIEGLPASVGRTVGIGEIAVEDIQPQETIKTLTERLLGDFNQNLRA
jgi:hypothetical protein